MALKITEQNGTFVLAGTLNTITADHFRNHFQLILNMQQELTLNIDGVSEIDVDGLMALKTLYKNALIYNKDFYITGYGCKEIYDDFKQAYAA